MTPPRKLAPETAPPRPDLTWIRHRRAGPPIEYVKHGTSSPPVPSPHEPAAPAAAPSALDLSTPAAPTGTPAKPDPPGASTSSGRVRPRTLPYPRVQRGSTSVLSSSSPTVTLTRLQSGIGQLQASLLTGAAAGDIAMGLICETADGVTHIVQRLGEAMTTPERPLPLARLEPGAETITLDLRQVPHLQRALLYGYSPSVSVVDWDVVVSLRTPDGSHIEAPVDLPSRSGVVALVTLYNVHGELVVRSEQEAYSGPAEMVAQAYGYRYAWLDGRLPSR